MSSKLRISLVAIIACVVTLLIVWSQQFNTNSRTSGQQIPADSIVRFATDDFVAACRVRPTRLIKHPYFGSLPIDTFLPGRLSLGRLDALNVEDLVVFCGPATAQNHDRQHGTDLEWAAVARTSYSIDLESVVKQWNQSLVPQGQEPEVKPQAVTIEGYECFRVNAGTFLASSRNYGELQFTDAQGRAAQRGVNVGNEYGYRSYIEGATKQSAIFTLKQIDESDLDGAHLPLEFRPDVFLTRLLDHEYATAQIEVRNPDNHLSSEPIEFEVISHVNHKLTVPRNLTATDARGHRQVDLLKDLVSKGRLEVIFKSSEPGIYVGVGPDDLNVRPRAFEYVFVSDRQIVVAQSPHTLKKMLAAAAAPAKLAQRLFEPSADIVVIAAARDQSQRAAMERLIRAIGDNPLMTLVGDALTDMTATVSVDEAVETRVTAEFADRQKTGEVMSQLENAIRSTKSQAQANIGDSLNRLDSITSLISMALDGVSTRFPDHGSPSAQSRESELLSIIADSLNNLQVETNGKVLTVEWSQPARFVQLSDAAQFAVANAEEILARDLFSRERFDLGDEMYQRVTDRFPHTPQAWFRRAHQLSYNTSAEFDGYENRYVWVRRGLDALLDGAEQNPDTTDMTWMAAKFLGWKIGDFDERAAYRALFVKDDRLHKRLARIVDLGQARTADNKLDNWLVAKLLFEHCVERAAKSPTSSSIPPLLFFSRPAAAQAGYAQSLPESGHWTEALQAWEAAERLYDEFGDRPFSVDGSEAIRLNDLEPRTAQFGPQDFMVNQLLLGRNRIQYDYWRMRCKLEQLAPMQLARKLSQQAAEHAQQSETRKAYDLYGQSLQALSEVHAQYPTEMTLFAGDFQYLAKGYRKVAGQLSETVETPSILTLIEQSTPTPRFLGLDFPDADE